MSGLRIAIDGKPAGNSTLRYTVTAEPDDLTPMEIALVLRRIAHDLDTGRMVQTKSS